MHIAGVFMSRCFNIHQKVDSQLQKFQKWDNNCKLTGFKIDNAGMRFWYGLSPDLGKKPKKPVYRYFLLKPIIDSKAKTCMSQLQQKNKNWWVRPYTPFFRSTAKSCVARKAYFSRGASHLVNYWLLSINYCHGKEA